MVSVAAAVVAHGGADLVRDGIELFQNRGHFHIFKFGACDGVVQVIDVGGVMLAVMCAHRLFVDPGFERVECIGQRG